MRDLEYISIYFRFVSFHFIFLFPFSFSIIIKREINVNIYKHLPLTWLDGLLLLAFFHSFVVFLVYKYREVYGLLKEKKFSWSLEKQNKLKNEIPRREWEERINVRVEYFIFLFFFSFSTSKQKYKRNKGWKSKEILIRIHYKKTKKN